MMHNELLHVNLHPVFFSDNKILKLDLVSGRLVMTWKLTIKPF